MGGSDGVVKEPFKDLNWQVPVAGSPSSTVCIGSGSRRCVERSIDVIVSVGVGVVFHVIVAFFSCWWRFKKTWSTAFDIAGEGSSFFVFSFLWGAGVTPELFSLKIPLFLDVTNFLWES